jgi:uncharacterized protein YhaN
VLRTLQRLYWRIQIQADDIADFFDEERVVQELETLRAMRPQPK